MKNIKMSVLAMMLMVSTNALAEGEHRQYNQQHRQQQQQVQNQSRHAQYQHNSNRANYDWVLPAVIIGGVVAYGLSQQSQQSKPAQTNQVVYMQRAAYWCDYYRVWFPTVKDCPGGWEEVYINDVQR